MKTNIINSFNNTDYSKTINLVLDKAANVTGNQDKTINIILVDDDEIKRLNNTYRHKNYVTDVLTFPDGYMHNLGDVFISIPVCEKQANELKHSFERELGFLCVHGFLHTLGYDHIDKEDEEIMIPLQQRILDKAKLYR
jgi:probable rRNA maturation factor